MVRFDEFGALISLKCNGIAGVIDIITVIWIGKIKTMLLENCNGFGKQTSKQINVNCFQISTSLVKSQTDAFNWYIKNSHQ